MTDLAVVLPPSTRVVASVRCAARRTDTGAPTVLEYPTVRETVDAERTITPRVLSPPGRIEVSRGSAKALFRRSDVARVRGGPLRDSAWHWTFIRRR